jgi:hypothetical protein
MDKTLIARLLADDPKEIDRRFFKPFPLEVPTSDLEGSRGFMLRKWQALALEQIRRNQRGQFHMQAGAGKKTLIAKICSYTPKPRPDNPDFRVLVVGKEKDSVMEIWRLCVDACLDVGLLDGRSTSMDERARIVCSTAASVAKVGGGKLDAMLVYHPYDLMTPETYRVLLELRKRVYRFYGFSDSDDVLEQDDTDRLTALNDFFGPVLLSKNFRDLVAPQP